MKRFKVSFNSKQTRHKHRIFRAPNLSEAQAQFKSTLRFEVSDCIWEEISLVDVKYQDMKTGEVLSANALYNHYLEIHPNREITFVSFAENYKALAAIE